MKNLHLIIVVAALLFISAAAMAEDSNAVNISNREDVINQIKSEINDTKASISNVKEQLKSNVSGVKGDIKQNITQKREQLKEEIKNMVNVASSTLRQDRESFTRAIEARKDLHIKIEQLKDSEKLNIEALKEEMQNKIETLQEDAKTKMETYRAQLKEQLKKIKDANKVASVEKIDLKLEQINTNQVNHFTNLLEQLDKVLLNIKSRTDKAQANNKDVAAVKTAITASETAIASARAVVAAQAGKIYKITVTTEEKLKENVQTARQNLFNDLKIVSDKVKEARDAVHNAAVSLAQIPRVDDLEVTATSTVNTIN